MASSLVASVTLPLTAQTPINDTTQSVTATCMPR